MPTANAKLVLRYKRFKDGRTSVDDDEHSERTSTSKTPENTAKIRETILAGQRRTIHDVCEIGLSYGTGQRILAGNLNMGRISAKSVPRVLSDNQKVHRISACKEIKQEATDDPNFISNIRTGDETWVCGYEPETKQPPSQWKSPNSPRPKKARQVSSNVKFILILFLTSKELSTRNSYPLVKPTMASFSVRF
jgi:hypothetical protein